MSNKNIEAIYPLSPMQQGMLFHTLYAPEQGFYVEQFSCDLKADLNRTLFKQAWEHILTRHAVLRTSVHTTNADKPLQVVHEQLALPWLELDYCDYLPAEQQTLLESFLQHDRKQGFILSQPPLMRLALIHLSEHAYRLVWSFHHILLDGWSGAILLERTLCLLRGSLRRAPSQPASTVPISRLYPLVATTG